jgi:hypothetical protein
MPSSIDPRIRALAEKVIAQGKNKRAIAVLKALLKSGSITTDQLNELGYNHPPRAVGDVRDAGIPIITGSMTSPKTGRRMAVYSFGDPSRIQSGRVGGRSAFPKSFKAELIAKYGSVDAINGARLDEKVLQIDHRIPYRISGDAELEGHKVADYMLLDGSSQRAKSWACEHCPNMLGERNVKVCTNCYWAFPDNYKHIATEQIRRADISWQGKEVAAYEALQNEAREQNLSVSDLIKRIVGQKSKAS